MWAQDFGTLVPAWFHAGDAGFDDQVAVTIQLRDVGIRDKLLEPPMIREVKGTWVRTDLIGHRVKEELYRCYRDCWCFRYHLRW